MITLEDATASFKQIENNGDKNSNQRPITFNLRIGKDGVTGFKTIDIFNDTEKNPFDTINKTLGKFKNNGNKPPQTHPEINAMLWEVIACSENI